MTAYQRNTLAEVEAELHSVMLKVTPCIYLHALLTSIKKCENVLSAQADRHLFRLFVEITDVLPDLLSLIRSVVVLTLEMRVEMEQAVKEAVVFINGYRNAGCMFTTLITRCYTSQKAVAANPSTTEEGENIVARIKRSSVSLLNDIVAYQQLLKSIHSMLFLTHIICLIT